MTRQRLPNNALSRVLRWAAGHTNTAKERPKRQRAPRTHIILIDGTLSTLKEGHETHIGWLYKQLGQSTISTSVHYIPGLQWGNWRTSWRVLVGRGLSAQIQEAYGVLAARYRPGDRIYMFGYSRGAFAVRSLSGMIDSVGLLRQEFATSRHMNRVWRRYRGARRSEDFKSRYCYDDVKINMMGIFDTVSALSVNLPWFAQILPDNYSFHNHRISDCILAGYHALALDETRAAYAPERWETDEEGARHEMQQVWFSGSHADVGGHLLGEEEARPLSNIPLIWMMEHAERHGLQLPTDWRDGLHVDPNAPSVGMSRGLRRLIWVRMKRKVKPSYFEWIHPSVSERN